VLLKEQKRERRIEVTEEEASDHTLCRTRFARGFGPDVENVRCTK
jgi:hypothetical protein